jgi:cysteinyl-tRNA synthetase
MPIQLQNTLSRKKETFAPKDPKNVGLYVCGPTVYDRPHIGNARAVVVYDVLFRLLRHEYGESHVTYVRNITDVDDKINAAAKENGEPIQALTKRITEYFHADMAALGNLPPTKEPKATEHISDMITMIKALIEKGHAYESKGHVLFAVKTDANYGKLSGRKLEDLVAGARVEVESYKKDAGDFVLWKPAGEGDDPSSMFESPWGAGRPGWHIECSAMSTKYLGKTFDIHGGGADLKFPHHENEIAQSCCANPESTFANIWVHNGFLTVNGEKMSKSLGNFTTVRELLEKGVKGEVIRYVLLATKYNEPLDFSQKSLDDAKKVLDKFYRRLADHEASDSLPEPFIERLCNDLNTPSALSLLHGSVNVGELKASLNFLGLLNHTHQEWFGESSDLDKAVIEAQITLRDEAKANKEWAKADEIRDMLAKEGIILEDTPSGTTWRKA